MDDKNAAEIHKTNILTKTFLLLLLSAASSFLRWTKEIGLGSHNIFYFNSPLLRLRWQYTIWSMVFYSRALLLNVTNSACGHEEAFFLASSLLTPLAAPCLALFFSLSLLPNFLWRSQLRESVWSKTGRKSSRSPKGNVKTQPHEAVKFLKQLIPVSSPSPFTP